MFPFIFALFLLALMAIDYIFMPTSARKAWRAMFFVFSLAAFLSLYQKPLVFLVDALGVGRSVDAVIYFVLVILIRELFLSRARLSQRDQQFTELVRSIACLHAKDVFNTSPKVSGYDD